MTRPMTYPRPHLLALLACVVAVGCATPPPSAPHTTVVLLPDEDGRIGAVSVTTAGGSQSLDRAYSAVTVQAAGAVPSGARDLGRDGVKAAYGDLLKAQPSPPTTFTLHFLLGKTALTDDSKALLPAMLEAVRIRKPTEISVFGHADASGSEEHNVKLSADRALVVADLLRKHDSTLDKIDIQSFGDKVPLVPSGARAATPRNRRAEVMIF